MAYSDPTAYSIEHGMYYPRSVTMRDLDYEKRLIEALKSDKTTFFVVLPSGGPKMAYTLDDKRKMVRWLRSTLARQDNLYFTWPGTYQSHTFEVTRNLGLVTRIQEILGPDKEEQRKASLKHIAEIKNQLLEARREHARKYPSKSARADYWEMLDNGEIL